MIISASYRSDIPAFHASWFEQRLKAGFVDVPNPYSRKLHRQSLLRHDVDGWVFWTRNIGPFMENLACLQARGDPFAVQYTVTGYPRPLEQRVPQWPQSVDRMKQLAGQYGKDCTIWRYDPILFTSLTPASYHLRQFTVLAAALAGACNEVVVSFAAFYRKTRRNLNLAANAAEFTWRDPSLSEKQALLAELTAIATAHGMQLTVCSQPDLTGQPARCIDLARLSRIASRDITARTKGNRSGCFCAESRDIGQYDTCGHGCMYCYAVSDHDRARKNLKTTAELIL